MSWNQIYLTYSLYFFGQPYQRDAYIQRPLGLQSSLWTGRSMKQQTLVRFDTESDRVL